MIKITLRELRILHGCTKKDATICLGVPEDIYNTYDKDPGLIPKFIACKMKKACGVSLDMIRI